MTLELPCDFSNSYETFELLHDLLHSTCDPCASTHFTFSFFFKIQYYISTNDVENYNDTYDSDGDTWSGHDLAMMT